MKLKVPQYKKLYEILRRNIIDGLYKEGDMLPSENDLCVAHRVTRPTVRQALTSLVHDGYIKKQQGKGSIVNSLPKGIGILSLESTTASVASKDLKTKLVAKPMMTKWEKHFIFPLTDQERGAGCIYFERQRIIEGIVVLYEKTWIPDIDLPGFTEHSLENQSLFDILREHHQIQIIGGEQNIRAIPANDELSHNLHLPVNSPVLILERKMSTNRIGFFIYSAIFCNTESYFLHGVF